MASYWPGLFGDSLFDPLRRRGLDLDDFFARTPWESGVRSAPWSTYPAVNVGDSAEQVDVYVFAAGVDPGSLDVSLRQNLLTVSGERKREEADKNFYRRERFAGPFQRAITLPEDVDPDKVEARYRNGVLHITVKRRQSSKPRQIEVH